MELKQAGAVCPLAILTTTLVLLVARSLDVDASSKLEPRLAEIVEELRTIREQGGIALGGGVSDARQNVDGLTVFYFHGATRCPTCESIEARSHDTVRKIFADELDSGLLTWKVLNYEEPANEELAKKFEVQMPVVVLAHVRGGNVQEWKRLDEVWALVGDPPTFSAFLEEGIRDMLTTNAMPADELNEAPVHDAPASTPDEAVPLSDEGVELPLL